MRGRKIATERKGLTGKERNKERRKDEGQRETEKGIDRELERDKILKFSVFTE